MNDMRRMVVVVVGLVVLAGSQVMALEVPQFRELFNGKDLAGWKHNGKPGSFTVKDGAIVDGFPTAEFSDAQELANAYQDALRKAAGRAGGAS